MSLRRLIMALTFLSIFAMASRVSIDTDTWWHLRTGQFIAENREVPKSDPFSYTREGEAWVYPSAAWLTELRLYLLYDRLGPGALNLWVAAVVTGAFALIYFALSGGAFLRAFVLILAASASGVYWAARPYMASFFFAALFLWVLEDFRWKRKERLYLLPIAMLFWVNSHPGFAIGFLLWGIYMLDGLLAVFGDTWETGKGLVREKFVSAARLRLGPLPHAGLFMLLAASLNPSGPRILSYPFETLSIGILRNFIEEWQSPNFHNAEVLPFLLLLMLCFAALGASKKRIGLSDYLLVAGFGAMALMAGRNISLFALTAPIVLTRHAEPILQELSAKFAINLSTATKPSRLQAGFNWILLATLFAAVLFKASIIFPAKANQAAYANQIPVAAVEYLQRENPPGKLFNSYNWGGYLIWALPEYPVFVDGRTDLYSDELLTEWLQIVGAEPGWQTQLSQREVNLILLEPHWPLVQILESEGWQQIYADGMAVIYSR